MPKYSYIHNSNDVWPSLLDKPWDEFIDWLKFLSKQERPATREFKIHKTPAIMPALFYGQYRRDTNVVDFGNWCCVDADKNNITADKMLNYFRRCELNGCIYSTTSHTDECHAIRGIFELEHGYDAELHPYIWDSVYQMFDEKIDRSCDTIGRIYYIPASWSEAAIFRKIVGKPLNVEYLYQNFYKERKCATRPIDHAIEYHNGNDIIRPRDGIDLTDDEIAILLSTICPCPPNYDDWISLSWAVMGYTPNAIAILSSVWPEQQADGNRSLPSL